MMKKTSKSLSLVLMGSLTVTLGGCAAEEQTEEYRAYQSVDECVAEQVFSPQECREMAVAAVGQNPQFASQAECEAQFGAENCTQAPAGESRSSWMPLIAGYMMGRYLGGGGMMQGAQPLYNQGRQPAGQPAGQAGRSFRTLGGDAVQAGKVASPSQTVRGGFTRSAKPYVARSGGGSRGGFFGGAASS